MYCISLKQKTNLLIVYIVVNTCSTSCFVVVKIKNNAQIEVITTACKTISV